MTATKGNLIYLHQRDPQEALERLNRITGLRFSSSPQSLVNHDEPLVQAQVAETAVHSGAGDMCGSVARLSR